MKVKPHKCQNCSGKGKYEVSYIDIFGGGGISPARWRRCKYCNGTGTNTEGYATIKCRTCGEPFRLAERFTRDRICPGCKGDES